MSEIERMRKYIERTGLTYKKRLHYDINVNQIFSLRDELSFFDALTMAFRYGQARGYRLAKAEVRRE